MREYIIYSLSFLSGVIIMGFITIPAIMSNWEDGFTTARNTYDSWSKGFYDGFKDGVEAGIEHYYEWKDDYKKERKNEL